MLQDNTFIESYTRIFGTQIKIDETGNRFFAAFYQRFLASSQEVAQAFKNTDMRHQQNMLKKSLLYSINFITNNTSYDMMHRIAVSHSKRGYGIKPELYDLWMDCMVATVAEFDPEFGDEVELAWRLAFSQAITYMKCMYDK